MSTDIGERLAGLRIEVAPATASLHLAAIGAEMRSPSPMPPRRMRRRRLPVVVLAAIVLVALTAAGAFAAETAVPGDRLYPVKQATEWVRTWIDPTVPADHRIDELETLIDRRAAHEAISDQLRRAEEAVAKASVGDSVVDAPLVDRLDQVRDRVPPAVGAPEAPMVSDDRTVDSPPIREEMDEQAPPTDGPRDQGGDALGDHGLAELTAWCEQIAAAHDRGDRVPEWALLRCHQLLLSTGDSP